MKMKIKDPTKDSPYDISTTVKNIQKAESKMREKFEETVKKFMPKEQK